MTKEELLAKGVSEEVADQVIAELDGTGDADDDALLSLQKALDGGSVKTGSLFKAEDEDEDDEKEDDEDEDGEKEKDMKKYMKKYMKENPEGCKNFMKQFGAKFGDASDKMEKAADDLVLEQDNIVEMADIAPFVDSQREFNDTMLKAVEFLASRIEVVAKNSEQSFDLMQKAARVTLEQSKLIAADASTPVGRRGVITTDMQKAVLLSPDSNKVAYEVLTKAQENRVPGAGEAMMVFESHGKNLASLNSEAKKFIADLIAKEGK